MNVTIATDIYILVLEGEIAAYSWYDSGVIRFLSALEKCASQIRTLSYSRTGKLAQYRILSVDVPAKQWSESLEYSSENPTNHKTANRSRDLPSMPPKNREDFEELVEGCYEMVNQLKITRIDITRRVSPL